MENGCVEVMYRLLLCGSKCIDIGCVEVSV